MVTPPRLRADIIRIWLVLITAFVAIPASTSAASPFPRPAELEPDIRFWTRVYTEVDTRGGFIHDSRHLSVVYEVVKFGARDSDRARKRQIKQAKRRYKKILSKLAGGQRKGLSREERRVLALWRKGVGSKTLRAAAKQVRFQLGQADKFRAGLIRSGAWRGYIEKTLSDMGLPIGLSALPHVESSFNPHAYSRLGAAGIWQFTRSTGRRFMRVDDVVDERLDPFKATAAAARLLKNNHAITGTWPMAITAYNHGASGVRRAARNLGTRNIATIVRRYKSRRFGFASRNFYVAFVAALHVQSNAKKYFGRLERHRPNTKTVTVPAYLSVDSVVRALGISKPALKQHNLALRPSVWKGSKRIPQGYELRVPGQSSSARAQARLTRLAGTEGVAEQERDRLYKVRRGNTLGGIASRFNVSVKELATLNNLRSRNRIRVGQTLRLPALPAPKPVQVVAAVPPAAAEPVSLPADGLYTVQRGDTLSLIASRFDVDARELAASNRIRNKHRIHAGQTLQVVLASPPPAQPADAAPTPPPQTAVAARVEEAAVAVATKERQIENMESAEPTSAEEAQSIGSTSPVAVSPILAADPSDYAVGADRAIEVQAAETLGHYSHWLEVSAKRLRRVNRMNRKQPVVIGQRIKLDFSRVKRETFEQRRTSYHQSVQEDYFAEFQITDTRVHEMQRNETLWVLARQKYQVPVWLLRQYNPDLDFNHTLHPGTSVNIPLVRSRDESPEPTRSESKAESRPS